MATNLLPTQPLSLSAHRSSDNLRRKTSGNASWWTPLFGWSTTADDYIDEFSGGKKKEDPANVEKNPARSRYFPGCFTEEKAKQLRMKMAMECGAFHDVMYHSAIASRLASDFSRRSDGH